MYVGVALPVMLAVGKLRSRSQLCLVLWRDASSGARQPNESCIETLVNCAKVPMATCGLRSEVSHVHPWYNRYDSYMRAGLQERMR